MNNKQDGLLERLSNAFAEIPFNQTLGLKLESLEPDQIRLCFKMKKQLIGNFMYGILHGGVISSVLDMAGGMVVMANAIVKNQDRSFEELAQILGKCSTVDLQISYLNPGKGDIFTAKAWLTKSGNKLSFTRMELYNEKDVLISTANGTYLVK